MKVAITVTRGLVGITGLVQVVLGILFWTGHAMALIQLHMIVGLVFVLVLMTLAVLGARAGAPPGLVVAALVWGLVIVALGMSQARILPGPGHWIVRVVHLLTGLAGVGLAGALSARTGAATKPRRTPSAPRTSMVPLAQTAAQGGQKDDAAWRVRGTRTGHSP